jgi:hypothetical protein
MAAGGGSSSIGAITAAGRLCRRRRRPSPRGSPCADVTDTGRPLARASINQALAAVTLAHRNAGHIFDRKHRVIAMTWSGISRVKAMTEVKRQAAPVVTADVRDLLAMLNTARNIDCRNAALLTLGWGAALRRSERIGLDWEQISEGGKGTGFIRIDERGILITLARSKASQDKAETVVIPRRLAPGLRGAGGLGQARGAAARPAGPARSEQPPPRSPPSASPRTRSRASSRRPCAISPASEARPWRRPRTWCAGSPATRSGPATPPVPRRRTCRRCASSSIRDTSRPTWWRATSASPTSGRSQGSRASYIVPESGRRYLRPAKALGGGRSAIVGASAFGRFRREPAERSASYGTVVPEVDVFAWEMSVRTVQFMAGSRTGSPKLVSRKSKSHPSLACLMCCENSHP